MPAKDLIHNSVKQALQKDGWIITADPYTIQYEELTVFADLGAERPLAAERQGSKIVVEVKTFNKPSLVYELELTLGQHALYLSFLEQTDPDRQLYIAIRSEIYNTFFKQKAVQLLVRRHQLSLLIVDVTTEEILEWINSHVTNT